MAGKMPAQHSEGRPRQGKLLLRLGGIFRGVVPKLFVVGLHILKRLSDFIGRFFGGGSHLVSGLNRGGVEFGGEVSLDLLEFVDRFGEFSTDVANFFVHVGVLFFGFVQSGLADGFEVPLHFGQIFFPVGEAGVGDGAEVIDSIREGGLDVFVVFELVGEVFEGIAGFVCFGGDTVELLDCFLELFGCLIDQGFDFFEVGGHLPGFFGCFLSLEGEGKEGDEA